MKAPIANKWLSTAEKAAYDELEQEPEKAAFRICQSLSLCTSDETVPPPLFYLSAAGLGARLGLLGMVAWRMLRKFEQKGILKLEVKGRKRTSEVLAEATKYRWLLPALISEAFDPPF